MGSKISFIPCEHLTSEQRSRCCASRIYCYGTNRWYCGIGLFCIARHSVPITKPSFNIDKSIQTISNARRSFDILKNLQTCALFSVTECQGGCLDYIIQNVGMLEIRWGSLRRKVFLLSLTPTHFHTAGASQEMFHTVHGTYLAMEWPTCTCSFELAIGYFVFTYPTCAIHFRTLELCPLVQPVFTTFL